MGRISVFALLAVMALGAATAEAYEFSLLNGMKLKGELKSFDGGRFYVETEFGAMSIDADKLDYIIVEEGDPGPCGGDGSGLPGHRLGQGRTPGGVMVAQAGATEAPAPLAARSVRPAPLESRSVGPGTFRGTGQ